ncbi:hypothetical protein DPIF89300162_130023 [Tenacibaculum maritimum]|nr:hypothetical protein DPIF89300162_130023 [Tenacibaculum maritimum]
MSPKIFNILLQNTSNRFLKYLRETNIEIYSCLNKVSFDRY